MYLFFPFSFWKPRYVRLKLNTFQKGIPLYCLLEAAKEVLFEWQRPSNLVFLKSFHLMMNLKISGISVEAVKVCDYNAAVMLIKIPGESRKSIHFNKP